MYVLPVPDPRDAWALAGILCKLPVNPSLVQDENWRRVATQLDVTHFKERDSVWAGLTFLFGDPDAVNHAVLHSDPFSPPPPATPATSASSRRHGRPASMASIERDMTGEQWLWEGYLPAARLSGIAAFEGCGKTRYAVDLARRLWFGLPWPDGSPPTLPPETTTLWVCSDGQHEELIAMGRELGLPPQALWFNSDEENPYDGNAIDGLDDLSRLEYYINLLNPGLVFIDSLTNATRMNMCSAQETQVLMTPLAQLAQKTRTTIVPLLHLSKEGQALGRRIKGLTRTLVHLECPDKNESSRLRLWVEKSYAKKPPALKVRMTDTGNEYEVEPPATANGLPGGNVQMKATDFIMDALALCNDQYASELVNRWTASGGNRVAFYRAVDALAASGDLLKDGGGGKGRGVLLHRYETVAP